MAVAVVVFDDVVVFVVAVAVMYVIIVQVIAKGRHIAAATDVTTMERWARVER